ANNPNNKTICRKLFLRSMVPQCTSLLVRNLSLACHCLRYPKRNSPYSLSNSERYSSLLKSVISSRVSSQTPETLQAEDEHIYGPIVKGQTLSSRDVLMSGETWEETHPPETPEYPPEVQGYMESISHILEDVTAVRATESTVQHDTLNYLGIVDCVAHYRGVLCVIDWKTSEKPKPFLRNTYDNPIQVAAYAGALNSDDNYKYQVENGLIVVAYKDGSPAHAHQLSSELMLEYWKTWLLRLEEFTEQR
uniref:Mitochondrial genome maintenance exonuclease 1 n=1 Tax=Seriola dumerili TaxID=41447 RepID=A0A3B4T8H8_SERDU